MLQQTQAFGGQYEPTISPTPLTAKMAFRQRKQILASAVQTVPSVELNKISDNISIIAKYNPSKSALRNRVNRNSVSGRWTGHSKQKETRIKLSYAPLQPILALQEPQEVLQPMTQSNKPTAFVGVFTVHLSLVSIFFHTLVIC